MYRTFQEVSTRQQAMVAEMKTVWVENREQRVTVFQETADARAHCLIARSRHCGLCSRNEGKPLVV